MNDPNKQVFYEARFEDDIAVIKIKKGVFELITDIVQSDKLIRFIDSLDRNNDTKCLIILNDPESFTEDEYDKFITTILEKNEGINPDNPCFCNKNIRFREINILNSIIRHLAGMQIIVVAGIQGTVVTPYFGASLVADFRYASENCCFALSHNKYGLHPSGGLSFFLSNMLHHSKSLEFQLKDKIMVKEAYEAGLITKILPDKDFEAILLEETKKFTRHKYCTIRDTKRLTNFTRKSIYEYFEFEAGLLNL